MSSDLPDAVTLASEIRAGRTSAADAVDAHLARIAASNPHLNALTVVFDDRARREADRIDRALAAGDDPGPLAGVPFSVKENIDLTWSATTEGWAGAADAVPARDATIVTRMRAAGAIPIGRGNMPDFGMRWDTDNDLFGRTLNPFDETRTAFGSSGGDAVAVSTGMSDIGLGNDFGGSVRLPAQALGVCGLRPSVGRVPRAAVTEVPVALTLQRFAVNGMLARSVADLETVLEVIAGPDIDDPVSLALPPVGAHEGPRRVALVRDPLGWGVQPDVAAGVDRAAAALQGAGWQVDEIEPPHLEEAFTLMRRLAVTEMTGGALPAPLGRSAEVFMRDSARSTTAFDSVADYADAWARRAVIEAAWRRLQADHPVIVGPIGTGGIPATDFDLGGPEQATAAWQMFRLVVVVNFLGLPAVAVPTGLGTDRLPTAVQLIGPMHGEAAALAAARDLEAALALESLRGVDPARAAEVESA